jgi:GntR family transcriptional repressor for pyruvate dehydrogenase complex
MALHGGWSEESSLDVSPIARPQGIAIGITQRVLDYLLSGRIEPGSKLPSERELVRLLGIGRSGIRDGLKPLVLLGILEVRPGDGTYLKTMQSDVLPAVVEWGMLLGQKHTKDLIEARLPIELGTVRLAALRRDDSALRDLHRLMDQMSTAAKAANTTMFVKADLGFHLRIAEASGNAVLRNMLGSIQPLLRVWMARSIKQDPLITYREHPPILEAIELANPDEAVRRMESHLAAATKRLYGTLEAHGRTIAKAKNRNSHLPDDLEKSH